jgi:hypothetical protein
VSGESIDAGVVQQANEGIFAGEDASSGDDTLSEPGELSGERKTAGEVDQLRQSLPPLGTFVLAKRFLANTPLANPPSGNPFLADCSVEEGLISARGRARPLAGRSARIQEAERMRPLQSPNPVPLPLANASRVAHQNETTYLVKLLGIDSVSAKDCDLWRMKLGWGRVKIAAKKIWRILAAIQPSSNGCGELTNMSFAQSSYKLW